MRVRRERRLRIEHLEVIENNCTVSMRKRFPKHLRACVSVKINKLLNSFASASGSILWPVPTRLLNGHDQQQLTVPSASPPPPPPPAPPPPLPLPPSPLPRSSVQFSMPYPNCSTRMLHFCSRSDTRSGHTFKDLWQNANK